MRNWKVMGLFIVLGALIISNLPAQSYLSRSRGLEAYQDLPDLMIKEVQPSICQDLIYLKYVAADTFFVEARISSFLQPKAVVMRLEEVLLPGSQEFVIPLMGIDDGWYQIQVYCKNRNVGICYLQICR